MFSVYLGYGMSRSIYINNFENNSKKVERSPISKFQQFRRFAISPFKNHLINLEIGEQSSFLNYRRNYLLKGIPKFKTY